MTLTTPPGVDATAFGDGPVIETRDPRNNELIAAVPEMTAAQVADAVADARSTFPEWSSLSYRDRVDHLLDVRDLLLDRAEELVDTICRETGKLEVEALATELMATCEMLDHYRKHGEEALKPARVSTGLLKHKRAYRTYEPLGVVGVISPWNYPFTLTMTPVLAALLAGNAVVLKPSEITPTVGIAIGRLFADAGRFPSLVRVVTGGGRTGDALVRSGVQKICFTGSVATGKKVMAAAADTLTPVLLELGGKDPMIVSDDADIDRAARGAVWGAFQNSGQTCMSVERVYVHESVYEPFVDRVVDLAAKVRQGQGDGHDIGSMTFKPQVDIVERHLADATAKGARVLVGGARPSGREGLWFEPTVLVDVDHGMDVMTDETFGPVLPIMKVASDDEAIRLANDSRYGLNSSVWTTDRAKGERLAGAVQAGSVCINDCIVSYAVGGLPFGGVKESGIGRVHGPEGLREFSQVKSVLGDRVTLAREPWWFPIPKRMGGLMLRTLRLQYRRGARHKLRGLVGRPRR